MKRKTPAKEVIAGASHNRKVRESLLGVSDIGFLSVGESHVSTLRQSHSGTIRMPNQVKNASPAQMPYTA